MKILLTTDNIGGVWTYTLNLARGLKGNGFETCIAVIGDKLTGLQKDELNFTSWYFIRSRQEWMTDPWTDIVRAGRLLLDISAAFRPDIVHLNSFSYGDLPWNIPVIVTAHSCVLSWWKAVKNEDAPTEWENYRINVEKGIRSADVIVAASYTMMKSVESLYEPAGFKVVIYNGADPSFYSPGTKEKFVFSMGRLWDEAKNISLLLQASKEIGYKIFIAGEFNGKLRGHFSRNVTFLGNLAPAQVAGWLSEAAIYALPVLYEPFGYTFLEAALSGTAIITGKIPSMKEIWEDTAVFIDPHNSMELALAVNKLMEDDPRREMLAEGARAKAIEKYSIDKMVGEYILLYNNVLQSSLNSKFKLQES
jgi:glycosyltransferase involved in cell wall biosynthesis